MRYRNNIISFSYDIACKLITNKEEGRKFLYIQINMMELEGEGRKEGTGRGRLEGRIVTMADKNRGLHSANFINIYNGINVLKKQV